MEKHKELHRLFLEEEQRMKESERRMKSATGPALRVRRLSFEAST